MGLNDQYDILMNDQLLDPGTAFEAPFLKFSVKYEEQDQEREREREQEH